MVQLERAGTDPALAGQVASLQTTVNQHQTRIWQLGNEYINLWTYGAAADGSTDDAPVFNAAVADAASANLPLIVPPGLYALASHVVIPSGARVVGYGARLVNTNPSLGSSGALAPMMLISGSEDVFIEGLMFDGQKNSFAATEYKPAIEMVNSTNIVLRDLTLRNNKGDGFILFTDVSNGSKNNAGILIDSVICINNYRLGGAITEGSNVVIRDCRFIGNTGTAPDGGLDIEPDFDASVVQNIVVSGCIFSGNGSTTVASGSGAYVACKTVADPATSHQRDITFRDCTFHGNAGSGITMMGDFGAYDVTVQGCTFYENGYRGIDGGGTIANLKVLDSNFHDNVGDGVSVGATSGKTCSQVTVRGNHFRIAPGLKSVTVANTGSTVNGLRIEGNTMVGGSHGVLTTAGTSNVQILDNLFMGQGTAETSLADDTGTRKVRDNIGVADN